MWPFCRIRDMKRKKPFAYCTFLIGSGRYLPGVLTFAYALRKQKIDADFICVVTEEVPEECAYYISGLYDRVYRVRQSLAANCNKKGRGDREKLFVRFAVLEVLRKARLHYEKIILCDADLLPLRNYAQLCRHPAPGGILNEKKEHVIGYGREHQWVWYDVYREIPPGARIPREITDRVKTDPANLGVNSVLYVFDENTIDYREIACDLEDEQAGRLIASFPWPDMQYMTCKLSGRWHNLDIRYASFNSFPDLHSVFGTHYAGMKPWDVENRSFLHYCGHEDYKLWICVFLNMMREHPGLGRCARLGRLRQVLLKLVRTDGKYVLKVGEYPELKHLLRF